MDNESVEILKELLSKGVITQAEYDDKIEQLTKEENAQKAIDQLKKLYEAGIFTKEEYEAKVKELTAKPKAAAKDLTPVSSGLYQTPKVQYNRPSTTSYRMDPGQIGIGSMPRNTKKKDFGGIKFTYVGAIILVLAIIIYAAFSGDSADDSSMTYNDSSDSTEASTEYQDPYEGLVEKEMPENEYKFTNEFGDDRPSQIIVENPTDYAYAMKFVDTSGHTVFYFFVRPQSTATMNMGLGTYYLKWAAGKTWYGLSDLFGPETVCQKDKDTWPFESGKYWTITMQPITNGNVHSETIDVSDF